jgi:predicted RNA-binding protein Jag
MADPNENYKKALENVESLLKQQEALNKSADKLKTSWGAIATEVFKLDGAAFFKQIPLSAEDIKGLNDKLKEVNEQVKVLGKEFGEALDNDENIKKFTTLAKGSFVDLAKMQDQYGENSKEYYEAEIKYLAAIRDERKELANISDEDLKTIGEHLNAGGDLSEIYDQLEDTAKNLLKANSQNPDIFLQSEIAAAKLHEETKGIRDDLEKGTKEAFSLKEGLKAAFSKNVVAGGLESLMTFDQTIHDVQKNTGIMMDSFDNSQSFAGLTRDVSEFGMSTAQAGEYMTTLSNELKSTDFNTLATATKDFAAIEGATGASAENVTDIAGELMRMGQSSGQVKDYMEGASKMAQKFGVSSKRAMEAISRNIKNIRTMGFKGGEESLTRMAIKAEKLNMNVDEIFDVAKRARNIEGAMDMASELQLAGGSFANINPMDLLSAARNGPEELQKILTTMGKDVGKFNEKTGKYEFDAVDTDRLQMVADATGQTLDSIQNMIQSNAEAAKKTDMFKGVTDGLTDLDAEMVNSGLSDMMKIGKDGKVTFDAESDMAKRMGVDSMEDLQKLSGEELRQKMSADAKNLEDQNTANASFSKSLERFWTSIQSLFNILQPVLEGLTWIIQGFTSLITGMFQFFDKLGWFGTILKWAVPMLLLFGTSFGASVISFIGKGLSGITNVLTGKSGIIGKLTGGLGKKAAETATTTTTDIASKAVGPSPGVGGGLTSLATGLSSMGTMPGVFKGILAVALAGPAFLLFVPALPGLLIMALVGAMGPSITAGFTAVAGGLSAFGNTPGVFKGILAILAATIPLMLFTLALPGMLVMALVGLMAGPIIAGFEAIALGLSFLGGDLVGVLKGSLAMLIIGAAMIPFVYALSIMGGIDWMSVLIGVGMLALIMVGLIVLGALLMSPAGLFLVVGIAALIGVGLGLMVFGASMMVFATMSQMMQGMDFSWMANLGASLLSAAPGLFFGGLALLYASPGLVFGSVGLMAISLAAQVAANVDWAVIAGMGDALSQAAGGLFLFSLSAMMFANPFVFLGMMIMVVAIAALAAVMVPLALSLQLGASSLTNFAIGLERLSAAADTLSDEKLTKLQKISETMAKASAAGNVAGAMASNAEGAGGGGGAGGVRKIEVDVKLNGRELQSFIVKDTAIAK